MTGRIVGWVIAVLVFNAAALLIMLQLPPHYGIPWTLLMGALVAWWHWPRSRRSRRLAALVQLRPPRMTREWTARWLVLSLLGITGTVGLVQLVFELDQADPGLWGEVAQYQENVFGMIAVMLLAGLVIPALEELVFRGRIMRTLMRRFTPRDAILASSLLFMIAHVGGPDAALLFIPLTLGLASGALVYLTRSIWPGIVLHALWNLLTPLTAGFAIWLGGVHVVLLVVFSVAAIAVAVNGLRRLAGRGAPFSRAAPS